MTLLSYCVLPALTLIVHRFFTMDVRVFITPTYYP